MKNGRIRTWFPARSFGFLQAQDTGQDVFFHSADIEFDLAQIVVGTRVSYELVHYEKGGLKKTKAAHIQLVPLGGGVQ